MARSRGGISRRAAAAGARDAVVARAAVPPREMCGDGRAARDDAAQWLAAALAGGARSSGSHRVAKGHQLRRVRARRGVSGRPHARALSSALRVAAPHLPKVLRAGDRRPRVGVRTLHAGHLAQAHTLQECGVARWLQFIRVSPFPTTVPRPRRGPHARAAPPIPAPLSQSAYAAPSGFYTARFYTACAMPPVPSGSLSCSVRLMGYACALAAATAASTVSLAKSNVSPGPPAALIELMDVLDTE